MPGFGIGFRPEYGTLAANLAGHPGEPFFNRQMVINAVSRGGPEDNSNGRLAILFGEDG